METSATDELPALIDSSEEDSSEEDERTRAACATTCAGRGTWAKPAFFVTLTADEFF